MICRGCGNQNATIVKIVYENGKPLEVCDDIDCGNLKCPRVPDVYFREPYFDSNLGDNNSPHGKFIRSKRHKMKVMQEQGLREAGDRYHGSQHITPQRRKREFSSAFKTKLDVGIKNAIGTLKRGGAFRDSK